MPNVDQVRISAIYILQVICRLRISARLFGKDVHVVNTVQRPAHAANALAAKAQHPRHTAKIQRMLKQFSHPSTARRPRKPYISGGR